MCISPETKLPKNTPITPVSSTHILSVLSALIFPFNFEIIFFVMKPICSRYHSPIYCDSDKLASKTSSIHM